MSLMYHRKEHIIFAEDEGKKVLYNPMDGSFFAVNEVGDFIWSELEQRVTVNYLIDRVAENFDVEVEELLEDISNFLEQLVERDLISKVPYKDKNHGGQ